ncbi:MAG: UDP-N-acetylmuramate dehydrogenase [Phycisphaerae bacterium]|nr:UDP-N-acetylmuramate dehydrogenase [Phycisphaerae bacterium]
MTAAAELVVARDAPIDTWFGVGGRASRLARPTTIDDLRRCLELDPRLRILGEGANLLVDDDGVDELVVPLTQGVFRSVEIDPLTGRVVAGAGASLQRLIIDTVESGLSGLESLAGIPATIGGAAVMNAGGVFGQLADHLVEVRVVDREGRERLIPRESITFGYRRSGLPPHIVIGAAFQLERAEREQLRARLKHIMQQKSGTQPLRERSAGCVFKNPTPAHPLESIPTSSDSGRVPAGLLIDRAGCKGMRVGGAIVSHVHANFIVADAGCTAGDIIALIGRVRSRVSERFGITLETEVVIWSKRGT